MKVRLLSSIVHRIDTISLGVFHRQKFDKKMTAPFEMESD